MQTTPTQERNTMKKALLTFIATGSATIAAVLALASPASAEVVEECHVLNMETFTVEVVPCEGGGPLIDPTEENEEDLTINIDLGPDFEFDFNPIDPEEEEDDTEENVDESAEENVELGIEENVDESAEENVELGIEENVDESAEENVEENTDAPAETEEIAITDGVLESQEELPLTGGMHLYMISVAALLFVLGTVALTVNKFAVANKTGKGK